MKPSRATRNLKSSLGSLRNGNGTETLGTAQNISRGVCMLAKADTNARTVCFLRESKRSSWASAQMGLMRTL